MAGGSDDPILSLPKGGGALSGLGETFTPDPHTGTGSFGIPLRLPAGRNGLTPSLRLAYSTGAGNGLLGLGWELPVPSVTRRVSGGVPVYDDTADTFVLAGAEELVRVAGSYPGVVRYRPRTEGLFALVEHVRDAGDNYWRVRAADGRTSWYGTPRPADAPPGWAGPAVVRNTRTAAGVPFEWRLTRTTDPFGNELRFTYGARDAGADGPHRWDQPLLTEVAYADHGDRDDPSFAVRVRFGYESRPDATSDYRAGFELRTTRRLATIRVETVTDAVRPVREYRLGYQAGPGNGVSLLTRVQLAGFGADGQPAEELPAVELDYTRFEPGRRRFTPAGGEHLPAGVLTDAGVELVDLFGGGLPDVVELGATVRYWRNLGGGRFDRPRSMPEAPAAVTGAPGGGVTLLDADGDGRADLLVTRPGATGVFPLRFGGGWDRRSFRAATAAPSFDLADPDVRLVDLDGDGVTDAIRSGARMECFFNHRERGWHATRAVERGPASDFPDVRFSDERVRLADMTGDGLADIVLLHDRNVEYWPNLGRGDWGARVSMGSAPALPAGYDPRRVHLGDLDGDGAADLVYVDDGRVLVWVNQGGNRWSPDPVVIPGTPPLTGEGTVRVADLLGSGTDQLVWSVTGGGDERLWLLDLTGGTKPYLLERVDNRIGAVTTIRYASSTSFYLADQAGPATRWRTPLPIPVHVVASVEVADAISGGRLTSAYRYHHGYWDGAERELRGFGLVDQLDTDTAAPDTPPLLTRTWFHQGAVGDDLDGWDEWDGSREHWAGDPDQLGHRAGVAAFLAALPVTTATRRARRDALRALRGRVLRTELYALDGSARAGRPYTVTEAAYGVALIAEGADGEPALVHRPAAAQLPAFGADDPRRPVFATFELARRATEWARGDDPRTSITFSTDHDDLARPLRQTTVACPRGWRAMPDPAEGAVVTRTVTAYARQTDPAARIADRVARTTGLAFPAGAGATAAGLRDLPDGAGELTGQTVHHYDGPAFTGLPIGQAGRFGTLVRTEQLMLTEAIAAAAWGGDVPPYLTGAAWTGEYPAAFRAALPARAGYLWHDGDAEYARGWWAQTARYRRDIHEPGRVARGLVLESRPALGADGQGAGERDIRFEYDPFELFTVKVTDPAGLATSTGYDYRAWQPGRSTDPNGTVMRFSFTPLGQLAASWTTGAAGEGDAGEPGVTLTYDLRAFADRGEPISVHATRRVDGEPAVEKREYSDGFGRVLQARTRAGETRFGDARSGDAVIPLAQTGVPGPITGRTRAAADPVNVIVSGWQTYDAKGRPVERYEPFYDTGWAYAAPLDAQLGAKVRLVRDPRGVVERSIAPDGSEQRVVQGLPADLTDPDAVEPTPWVTTTYDPNDNAARTHGPAATVPAHHHDTPSTVVTDPAGRPLVTILRNRVAGGPVEELRTSQVYDLRGNAVELTDPAGRVATRNVRDLARRLLRTESVDAGVKLSVPDAAGTPVEWRDGRGALLLRASDRGGRPAALWARDDAAGAVTMRQRLAYGDGGIPGQPPAERAAARAAYRLGKLVTVHDEAGRLDVEAFDHRGNPRTRTRRVVSDAAMAAGWVADWDAPDAEDDLDPAPLTWELRHDALDRMTLTRFPADADGERKELRPEYDQHGGLRRVTLDGQVYVERIARNARGQRTLVVYGNGVVEASAHDPATFRLRRVWSGHATATAGGWTPGAVLRDTAWDHDLGGNTTGIADRAPGAGTGVTPDALDRHFAYDACYRLVAADGRECDTPVPGQPWGNGPGCTDPTATRAYTETYGYDRAGNLTGISHAAPGGGFAKTLTMVPGTNRLARVEIGASGFGYTYDAAGNVISETTSRHLEWDHAGRLREFRVQAGAGPASVRVRSLYDANGHRVKRLVLKQGGPAESSVTLDDRFERHTIGGVTSTTLHVMDDQTRVATVRVGPALPGDGAADSPVAYHLGDELDSSTVVVGGATAAAAATVRREEYGAWGETTFGSYARKRYRFAGKERDEVSGLVAMGARHYAPWLGRWVSADPAGPADGPNLFAYARNNPVSRTDPAGTDSEQPDDNGYRDAGAGPTDVSGAGAQQPSPPTSTEDTYSGPAPTPTESNPSPWSLPDAKGYGAAAAAGGGLIPRGGLPPTGGVPPPAYGPGAGVQLPGTGWGNVGYAPGAPAGGPVSVPGAPGGGPVTAPGAAGAGEAAIAPGAGAGEAAIAPGAATGLGGEVLAIAGEVASAGSIVIGAGLTFASDGPVPPPAPTSAELDQAFVRIAREQNARLENAVRNWDFSLLAQYTPGRMKAIMKFAQSAPWLAYRLLHMAYGKTLELMIDEALELDDVTGGHFTHLGGANQADWKRDDGVLYDVCTVDTADEHTCRFYGEHMRIFTHRGLPDFNH